MSGTDCKFRLPCKARYDKERSKTRIEYSTLSSSISSSSQSKGPLGLYMALPGAT
uniref:Uncharacterized protein n=1 Tax=Utricularia reniformis TaxID=192314 RepID=A0A1Y0AZZ4_9LAMI|nr:hypothetical protein AEK19_MT0500 [Utricularia reniformis]ART30756.1 hypothetical protein AEK19_MT0500 [Utricularia reniformis]